MLRVVWLLFVAGHNEHELAEVQFKAGEDHSRSERKDRSTGTRS